MVKKLWGYIVAAFAILIGLIFLEKSKKDKAESELASAEHKKNDAILADRVEQDKLLLETEKKALEAEKGRELTAEELADFFNKK